MMWMGKVSAWGALAVGSLFAVNAYFQFATGVSSWVYAGTAVLLVIGGYRTLRQMSGGLRLLAGAWGLAAGVNLAPFVMGPGPEADNANTYSVDLATGWLVLFLQLLPLVGLALTVLHKERKG